jgi:Fic family protein
MATTDRAKSDWIDLLEKANADKAETPPKGFYTKHELVKITGISLATIERKLPILVEEGKAVRGYYRRINRANALVMVPFYKLLEKRHK